MNGNLFKNLIVQRYSKWLEFAMCLKCHDAGY